MTTQPHRSEFSVLTLTTDAIELRCAPQLGGRVFSLVNRRSGREWLWRQQGAFELFKPTNPLDFGTGCFAGLDECLPSVGACLAPDGRKIPDHGALWARAWTIDSQTENGFELSVDVPEFGLRFSRETHVTGSLVRFNYTLKNVSFVVAPALWCMHPLFKWQEGDRLDLPTHVTRLSVQGAQPEIPVGTANADGMGNARPTIPYPEILPGIRFDEQSLTDNQDGFLKAFSDAYPDKVGLAALRNATTGDRLDVSWDAAANPFLGIWLTRGGFRGWHHIALEPTNAPHDHVDVAAKNPAVAAAVSLAPGEQRAWWVEWRVS